LFALFVARCLFNIRQNQNQFCEIINISHKAIDVGEIALSI